MFETTKGEDAIFWDFMTAGRVSGRFMTGEYSMLEILFNSSDEHGDDTRNDKELVFEVTEHLSS